MRTFHAGKLIKYVIIIGLCLFAVFCLARELGDRAFFEKIMEEYNKADTIVITAEASGERTRITDLSGVSQWKDALPLLFVPMTNRISKVLDNKVAMVEFCTGDEVLFSGELYKLEGKDIDSVTALDGREFVLKVGRYLMPLRIDD